MTLITKLQNAKEGSRELDCEIGCAVGAYTEYVEKYKGAGIRYARVEPDGSDTVPGSAPDMLVPHYTTSIDDALTLVPEGWGWKAESDLGYGHQFTVGHVGSNCLYDAPESFAIADTPALALCIAALLARTQDKK